MMGFALILINSVMLSLPCDNGTVFPPQQKSHLRRWGLLGQEMGALHLSDKKRKTENINNSI